MRENIHVCSTVVSRADTFDNIQRYLLEHADQYSWLVSEHNTSPEAPDGCHGVRNDHHHWIIWNEVHQDFSNSGFVAFMRRASKKWAQREPDANAHSNRFFNHQPVKNLQSMLLYLTSDPRTILWDYSKCDESIKTMVDKLPEQAKRRMKDYVTTRDGKITQPIVTPGRDEHSSNNFAKVNLENIIELMMKDGAINFNQWQDSVFRLHKDPTHPSRKILIRIMGHPAADKLIKSADAYIRGHVNAMSWEECMRYQHDNLKSKEKNGEYMGVAESKNWIKRICRFNDISVNEFVNNVITVMQKKLVKINTLFLYGGSNAGKSKMARSIVEGMLVIGQTTRSDTFLFQDLPGCQVTLMEELRIVQETVDDIKRLFEGAKMKVDVKNKDPRELKRQPVIVCSNTVPEWWVPDERQALRNRMFLYEFKPMDRLKDMPNDINPLAWLSFIEELADNDTTDDDEPSPKQMKINTETVSIVTEQEDPLPEFVCTITDEDMFRPVPLGAFVGHLSPIPESPMGTPNLFSQMNDEEKEDHAINEAIDIILETPPPESLFDVYNRYQTQPSDEEGWDQMQREIDAAVDRAELDADIQRAAAQVDAMLGIGRDSGVQSQSAEEMLHELME